MDDVGHAEPGHCSAMNTTAKRPRTGAVPSQPVGRRRAEPGPVRRERRYQLDTSVRLMTPAERVARGRELRARVPRSSHAGFEPAADRPDPVSMLAGQSAGRLPDLVPRCCPDHGL
jgi:hypothetical protein